MSFKTKRNTTRTLTTTAVAGLAALCLFSLSACSSKAAAAHSNGASATNSNSQAISGSVSTNGSTSMEKVIGGLSEKFMAENSQVKSPTTPQVREPASNRHRTVLQTSACPRASWSQKSKKKALKQRLSLSTASRSRIR